MKILLQSRANLFKVKGGDTVQIIKTAESLKKLGCHVDISTEMQPVLRDYDIVHVFNISRPQDIYLQCANAKLQGKPLALSTIFVDYSEYDTNARLGFERFLARKLSQSKVQYLKVLARILKNREFNCGTVRLIRHGYKTLQDRIITKADVLLPNSISEMNRLKQYFNIGNDKFYVVVPNAVDVDLFCQNKTNDVGEYAKFEGSVLCVGRIEGNKCQLDLVRAMKGLPWQLVIAGCPAPNHMKYYSKIVNEADSNVHLLGYVDHDKLPYLYRSAKVHCLISWMETTGLSSLEAAAMGCNIVITDHGDTYDYFGDNAYYCQPNDIESIRSAIIMAYYAERNDNFIKLVREKYTWELAAEMTFNAYCKIL